MPKAIKVKLRTTDPLQVTMENDFTQNTSYTTEQVFDETSSDYKITSITIEGAISGHSSPLVLEVEENEDCTITIEYEEL